VFTRNRDAVRVDDIGLYALRSQPAREPEPIAAGLEGDRDACDLAPGLDRLISMTAIRVLFCSKAVRDRLRSLGFGMETLHRLVTGAEHAMLSPDAP